jgi:hypothetical protein
MNTKKYQWIKTILTHDSRAMRSGKRIDTNDYYLKNCGSGGGYMALM